MKAIVRKSDGKVLSMWDHDQDHLFGVPDGAEKVEIPETVEAFEKRIGGVAGKGSPEWDGKQLKCRAPEPPPTVAGELRRARKARGAREDEPVTIAELEAAEAALEKRRNG